MQNFVNAIPPLNFLVCALLLSVSIWLIQSWIRCFAHSKLVFASYALHAFLLVNKIRNIIGRQCDLKLINSTFGTEYKAKHWRDKQQITEVATYIKLGKEDVAQLISNPDFSADERRVIIDFVHYGLTVDQIRSYVENEKHFTLEGLQYGLYKMLFTKEK